MKGSWLFLAGATVVAAIVMVGAQAPISLPPSLERQIPKVTIQLGPDGRWFMGVVDRLVRDATLPPMGVEAEPSAVYRLPPPSADPRLQTQPPPPVTMVVGPGSLSAALNQIHARFPQYDLWVEDGMVGIAPSALRRDPKHFLNAPIAFFRVKDMSFHRAVTTLLNQLDPSVRVSEWLDMTGVGAYVGGWPSPESERLTRPFMDRKVTLSVTNASARDILNRLVAQHGEMVWLATYEDSRAEGAPPPVQDNCVVHFFANAHGTWPVSVSLRSRLGPISSSPGATVPSPLPAPATTPMNPPASGPRLALNLPPQPENVISIAGRLGTSERRIFGIEVLSSMPPAPPPPGNRQSYDLTGLAIPDALNKIVEFLPAYAWSADGDVIHIRPKGAGAPAPTVLDARVPTFAGRFDDLQLAQMAVAALLERRPVRPPMTRRFPPPNWSDEIKALVTRPVEVDLADVTIRQILDEIARKHGAMSWAVSYRGSLDAPQSLQLGFIGFGQWSVNTTVTIAR